MMSRVTTDRQTFREDVLSGLGRPQKKLSSKYFYDAEGDAIFQEIMDLEEYYLTRSEMEIFRDQSDAIVDRIGHEHFDILELGAGDGIKTKVFLENCLRSGRDITYVPLDISANVLTILKERLSIDLPDLDVQPLTGEYPEALESIDRMAPRRLLMFIGSTIGNFTKEQARSFMRDIGGHLRPQDHFLLGVDLKKHPKKILAAYDDKGGVTRRFNLNLLKRINRELGANFDLEAFDHFASYDPISGTVASFLVSTCEQEVQIDGQSIHFQEGEPIHTEVSMKYSREEVEELGKAGSLQLEGLFMDSGHNYCLALYHKGPGV